MKTDRALGIVLDFKGDSLKGKLSKIKSETIGKSKSEIVASEDLFDAALVVKKASAQINEIVHAVGIINSLPKILSENEIVTNLSLAAGAEGDGFDLETDKRVAEFKFSKWQDGGAKNGMRKRHVFADFVNLTILKTDKKKELYAVSAESILKYLSGRASWERVLSKSGGVQYKLADYLREINRTEIKTLREVFEISNVQVIDIEEVLKKPVANTGDSK
ncbi:hypothetical protein [Maribacter aquivivus]|uniref:hypothetical protein n=1 Tax=Maribacter aquivivus TaxID=228958 RepID=UPI001114BD6C|nr:hypothetical protein [Maribacter aquivivus]